MSNLKDFLKQTRKKTLNHSVKCGVCGEWLLKSGINKHLKLKHSKEYENIKTLYYELVENYGGTKKW